MGKRSSRAPVPSGSWNYNADDELSSETYDQDGNVTQSGANQFSYDSQNQMVSMNGGAVQIMYDGDGNRVAKTTASGTTRYLVDDLNPTGLPQVMDELTNGVVTRTYTYGLQRISEYQSDSNGAWAPSFYSYDGIGSVRQLTNLSKTITDTYEYDAFGNEISHTGTTPNSYLYRGEQWDSDLGLYYLRARYYNPMTNRFLSRDPEDGDITNPATLHKYLYANGDPVDLADPTGRYTNSGTLRQPVAGPAGQYVAIVIAVSLQAVPAVRTYEAGLLCLLASDTTKFTAEVMNGLLYQDSGEVVRNGDCTWKVEDDCDDERTKCLDSGLADYNGRTFGNQRCLECYDRCVQLGHWPTKTRRSTGGTIRCDYWNFPKKGVADSFGVAPLPLDDSND